ncbi:unnamed protein product [Trichobilharzia szidati]|nr:unnamed protein product [Trichobilharzia szidati]
MVYFTYSQVAFVTLLAFAAIHSVESLNKKEITFILDRIKDKIPGVISELKAAEGRVQNITAKILSQRASLRGQLEKYTDCLETAYKYKWGQLTFNAIADDIYRSDQGALDDTRHCCLQEAAAYHEKMEAFPVDECRKILPPANREDLKELKEQIEGVFYHNYLFSAQVFYKNSYTTLLKSLTGK